ncbi:MAG: nucleotidyltransferase domain-containing protein [Deltaproteobacteria bacterium]|nr:nucleotidyltransferase domain-containing protein [Deltaproteobacteria bacterium]
MPADALKTLKFLVPDEHKAVEIFESRIREALLDNLMTLEVFGSKVRGNFEPESDIDIFVLVRTFTPDIITAVAAISSDISIEMGVLISPVVLSNNEYEKNARSNTFFFQEIKNCGVLLYGST